MCPKIRVVLSEDAFEVYEKLRRDLKKSKIEATVFRAIEKKIGLIKNNAQYGEPVAKKLIPKRFVEQYGVRNLFWVSLPNFWRMLYTLDSDEEIEIVAFVLHISDHREYNKLMNYNKK